MSLRIITVHQPNFLTENLKEIWEKHFSNLDDSLSYTLEEKIDVFSVYNGYEMPLFFLFNVKTVSTYCLLNEFLVHFKNPIDKSK